MMPFVCRAKNAVFATAPLLLALAGLTGCPSPSASFSAWPMSGEAPLSVSFADDSYSGGLGITSWSWEFGDGHSSSSQNPTHTYTEPGTYDVRLRVSGPGGSDSVTWHELISVTRGAGYDIELLSVPAGAFEMGDPFSEGDTDELPVHEVYLDAYAISKYEITNAQVIEVYQWAYDNDLIDSVTSSSVTHNGVELLDLDGASEITFSDEEFSTGSRSGCTMATHPVVAISWYGAVAFCNWLSEMEEKTPCYDLSDWSRVAPASGGYRLPTEAEWERAAAWDADYEIYYRYGQSSDTISCESANRPDSGSCNPLDLWADPYTAPVGWYDGENEDTVDGASPVGCYDMSGNVMEWCEDQYSSSYYSSSPRTNPCNSLWSKYRVTRGGSWGRGGSAEYCRSASRYAEEPDEADGHCGFRMATGGGVPGEGEGEGEGEEPPSAAFRYSTDGLGLSLTDTSDAGSSDILSWVWSFGDGATSTSQNPSHTYSSAGTYIVTLTVTTSGGSDSCSRSVTVTAPAVGPEAAFTHSAEDLTVSFTDASEAGSSGITEWAWSFGDGSTSSQQSPTHTYSSAGTYDVTLTVTTSGGSDSCSRSVTVTAPVIGPEASFTYSAEDLSVSLTDTSEAGSSAITKWAWNFGDGSTSTRRNPAHTYSRAGTYDVTLTVTTSAGSDSCSRRVTVTAPVIGPEASFTYSAEDLSVSFTDTSEAGSSAITKWAWNFGDGSSSTRQNPAHTYGSAGDYTVALTITTAAGTDSYIARVTVTAPSVVPTASFTHAADCLYVSFTDTSEAGSSAITKWAWNFGDGSTSTRQNPTHTYGSAGDYTVALTITTAAGTDSCSESVTVTAASEEGPDLDNITLDGLLPGNTVYAYSGEKLHYSGTVTSDVGLGSVCFHTYSKAEVCADSGDDFEYGMFSYSLENWYWPSTPVAADTYTKYLIATDTDGNESSVSWTVVVSESVLPSASFTYSADCLSVSFTDTSEDGSLDIEEWAWSFGDGSTSTVQSPSHTYGNAGTYTVSLTVTSAAGSGSCSKNVIVTAASGEGPDLDGITLDGVAPGSTIHTYSGEEIHYSGTVTSDAGLGSVCFSSYSKGETCAGPDEDFEYGMSSYSLDHWYWPLNPVAAGTYTKYLIATDTDGNESSVSWTVVVWAPVLPTASFTYTAENLSVSFTDTSVDGSLDIEEWGWSFGDGSASTVQSPSHAYGSAGTYTVSLTVTSAAGSSTCSQSIAVTAAAAPGPNLENITLDGVLPGGTVHVFWGETIYHDGTVTSDVGLADFCLGEACAATSDNEFTYGQTSYSVNRWLLFPYDTGTHTQTVTATDVDGNESSVSWEVIVSDGSDAVADWYVKKGGTGSGTSWGNAFGSIQAAVDAASAERGGEIWVAEGAYGGIGECVVEMKDSVRIYGGFAGTETARGQSSWRENVTTISGAGSRRGVLGADYAILEGFVIYKGHHSEFGGGMYNNDVSPIVINCIFYQNSVGAGGLSAGGGLLNQSCSPIFWNCLFIENSATAAGGGVCNYDASPTFVNCTIVDNSAFGGGGVYSQSDSTVTLLNCTISRNSATEGGGIWNYSSLLNMKNCILWNNSASVAGSEILRDDPAALTITYSCVHGGYAGEGNIASDPLFSNPDDHDYELTSGSPCIDAGTPEGAPTFDADEVSRPQGEGYDIGAYEYVAEKHSVRTGCVLEALAR